MFYSIAVILALACGAAFIAVFSVGVNREIEAAVDAVDPEGAAQKQASPRRSSISRGYDAVCAAGAGVGRRLSRAGYLTRAQHHLDVAGNPPGWSVYRLLVGRGLGMISGFAIGAVVGARHSTQVAVLLPAMFGILFFALPDTLMRRRGEARQARLRRDLPDAMDMLAVCVQAGLALDAAIGRVARMSDGPVADEFGRVLQEMQLGVARAEALRALAARSEVPELRSFVAALVQATDVGISIGDVLDEQARQMRIARRQRAEEKAQKMQVKLLLPLITCLLPAMFVVVLGPAVMHLAQFFHSAN